MARYSFCRGSRQAARLLPPDGEEIRRANVCPFELLRAVAAAAARTAAGGCDCANSELGIGKKNCLAPRYERNPSFKKPYSILLRCRGNLK